MKSRNQREGKYYFKMRISLMIKLLNNGFWVTKKCRDPRWNKHIRLKDEE